MLETKKTRRPRGLATGQSRWWYMFVRRLLGLIFKYWVRCFSALGVDNVPETGGAFLVANHASALDPFVVSVPLEHRMMVGPGKTELFTNPIVGGIMRKLGIFPLKRDVPDPAAVRAMVELYRAGRVVIVFPEETRTRNGQLLPFDPGFARLAIKLKAPIIPTGLAGTNDVLPIHALVPRRNTSMAISYGQAFHLSEFYEKQLTPELIEDAANVLRERVEEQVCAADAERKRLTGKCASAAGTP